MDKILIKRGTKEKLEKSPPLSQGELFLAKDEERLYVGGPRGNISLPTQKDLDEKYQEVATQLEHLTNRIYIDVTRPPAPLVGAKADANYYDEKNKKYYKDAAMTEPATDNQPAFQGVVNYLSQMGGGTIIVPPGKYCFRSGVKWQSKVSLIGAGIGSTSLLAEGVLFDLIYNLDGDPGGGDGQSSNWLEDCLFKDFQVDLIGLSADWENVNGKAIFILYMKRARFENLLLKNTIGTALGCDFLAEGSVIDKVITINAGRNWGNPRQDGTLFGIGQSGIGVGTGALDEEELIISNCITINSGNHGIFVEAQRPRSGGTNDGRTKYAKIINCFAIGNRIGIANKGSGATLIDGCTAFGNKEAGIRLSQRSNGDQIVNCQIAYNGGHGIEFDKGYKGNATVSNNHIYNNNGRGIIVYADTIYGHIIEKLSIKNNKIYNNGWEGIYVVEAKPLPHKRFDIDNNEIFNNGQSGNGRSGVTIQALDGLNLRNNTIYDDQETITQKYPIQIGVKTINYFIDGNDFSSYEGSEGNWVYSYYEGEIGNNHGFPNVVAGRATLEDGVVAMWVEHYISRRVNGRVPRSINVTPLGNGTIWVQPHSIEPNRFRVQRADSSGDLEFLWEVRL